VVKHLKKHHVNAEVPGSTENRFQDPNLNERFIWSKKIEKEVEGGASFKDLDVTAEKDRQRARLNEIEKVKKSREEREAERARQQEELSMIERARLASEAATALEKEEDFLLQQAIASCKIRIESGRVRPLDSLVRVLLPELCWGQSDPPYKILQKMNVDQLSALTSEIKDFKEMDHQDKTHVEYWNCIEKLCKHELHQAKKQESAETDPTDLERSAYTKERQFYVEEEIQNMLAGKSLSDLVQLEQEIRDLLRTADNIDPDYWTRVLENLEIEKLKTKVRSIQTNVQKSSLEYVGQSSNPQLKEEKKIETDDTEGRVEDVQSDEDEEMESTEDCPSPEPCTSFDGMDVIPEDEDYDQVALLRRQVQLQFSTAFKKQAKDAVSARPLGFFPELPISKHRQQQSEKLPLEMPESMQDSVEYGRLKSAAISSMGSDEGYQPFGGEVELESHVYWWHEKYRPRKPKYFNRVHTGYEWNKYNQTHYDHDNPPPKVVQGYKFNIFYPDLIDKKTPPVYEIENDPGSKDSATCWLRFKAGPPYEDLAFRIVNKEWEYSHKKGFKCTFERGILHLYFNFKRQRYRR